MFGFSKLFKKKDEEDSLLEKSNELDQKFFASMISDSDYQIDTSEFQDKNFYRIVREGFG